MNDQVSFYWYKCEAAESYQCLPCRMLITCIILPQLWNPSRWHRITNTFLH